MKHIALHLHLINCISFSIKKGSAHFKNNLHSSFLIFVSMLMIVSSSFAQIPTITSFSPTSGAPGTTITIIGTNFNTTAANNKVKFGAKNATVTTATATNLTVTVPVGATYEPITVLNVSTFLTSASKKPFLPTFSPNKADLTLNDISPKVDYATTGTQQPYYVAIGDLDGDGKPDLVVANYANGTISVFRNNSSNGSITNASFDAKIDFATGANPISVAIGDLNGDGKPELAVTNYGSASISIFRNTSSSGSITTGSFAAKVDFTTGTNPRSVAISDLDGDGKPDLAIANTSVSSVSVLRNTSTTTSISFATKVDYTCGANPHFVAIGDLDGDGKPDLATANNGNASVSVLRNISTSGIISFQTNVDLTAGSGPISVAIGDLDNDGKAELVVANFSNANLSVFKNTATSGTISNTSFATKLDFTAGAGAWSVAIGDIDGDGKPDLAVANAGVATISILRNTTSTSSITTSSFAPKVDFSTATATRSVTIGDLDLDGKPDLVAANYTNATISIFRNNPKYSITYDGNTNTSGTVPTVSYTSIATSTTVSANTGSLTKTGYTFAGWNTLANGSGTSYAASGSATLTINANVTLFAQWTANTLTVIYNSQLGSAIANSSTTTGGSIATSPGTPTRAGYTFNGWYNAATGGSAISFPYTHGQTANFTLYSQWTANTLTVTYNSQLGTAITSGSTTTGGSIATSPGTPTRTNYTFNGWFAASMGGSAISFPYTHGQTANFTLYAQWNCNTSVSASSTQTLCINTPLTNITQTTISATGIGTSTGLPSGVTAAWASNTITISGTPTVSGIFNYSIPLTGGCGSVNATGLITVNGASIASSNPTVCINTLLTNITHTTIAATGIGTATNLPAGVTASWGNNTITISGTPTEFGEFIYSIPLTVSCGSAIAIGTITVNPNNLTAGAASSTPILCINTPLTNISHTTTGATGITTYAPAPIYALPPAVVNPTTDEDLGNVTITLNGATVLNNSTPINSLSGTIGTATGTVGSYADFTALGHYALYPGSTYSFSLSSITTGTYYSNAMAIYIDYNRNGLFSDAGEKVYAAATTTSGPHTETGTFTIPLSASLGLTRMRVISNEGIISSPTESISWGEYEEYSIILGASSGLPAGVTASWSNNTVTISGTPHTTGTFNYSIPLTGGCGTANATGTIMLTSLPLGSASAQTRCSGVATSVALNSTVSGTTFTWTAALQSGTVTGFSNQTIGVTGPIVQTLTNTTSTIGVVRYTVTPTANGCSGSTFTVDVTVNPAATSVVLSSSSTSPICSGTSLTLTASEAVNLGAVNAISFTGGRVSVSSFNISPAVYPTLTASAWAYRTGINSYGAIISNDDGSGFDRAIIVASDGYYHIFAGRDINTGIPSISNNWEFVSVTWSSTGITFYKNGVSVFTSTAESISSSGGGIGIGCNPGNSTPFIGTIDQVSVFSTARSALELQNEMNFGLGGSETGLQGFYRFNEGSGTTTADTSPNARTGTLNTTQNTTWTSSSAPTGFSSYLWSPGGQTTPVISVSPSSSTNYTLQVTNTYSCSATSNAFNLTVNPIPVGSATVQTTCSGMATSVELNSTLSNTTFTWTAALQSGTVTGFSNQTTGVAGPIGQILTNTTTTAGTVRYIVTPITTANGCSGAPFTVDVTVNPANTVGAASTSPTLCINTALTNITHTTTGATGIGTATGLPIGVTAAWVNNVITISGTPTQSGIFNYTLPLTGGCGSVNATGTITVYANNTVSAASSTPSLCINSPLTNIISNTTGATGIGTASGLPAGVAASWVNDTITIGGTPSASGTFNYSIPLTGGFCNINATGTITVNANMAVYSLPLDIVPNASLALSLSKLSSAYSGSALRLRRASDNQEQDFGFAGNELDVNAITAWLNGASGFCTKLYDQSGNGGDVSQTTPSAQPLLVLSGFNNKPLLRFTTAQTMNNAVNYPAPFSVIYGSRVIGTSRRVLSSKINNWLLGYHGGLEDRAYFEGWTSEGPAATVLNQYNSFAATGTGSISTFYKNGIQIASNGNGLQGPNGIQLNGYGGSYIETSDCEFTDVIIFGSVLAPATIAEISDNIELNYEPQQTVCINSPLTNIIHNTTRASGIGTATGLPTGVSASWANNTITISGTPTVFGIFNYSIPLTGGCGSANATGTITVNGASVASSTPILCTNSPLTNITHTTSGVSEIGTATGLPTGVTASWANNTITISGTPTEAGTFNYSIPLTGGLCNATGTITVTADMTVTSIPPPPLDFSPNASLALSLKKLSSAYIGAALRLRRASDNEEQDFGFVGNELDVNAISVWLNGACGFCTKLYDQSGNGGDVSQTTPSAQPLLVLSGFNNKPLLRFTTAQTMNNAVNYPAPFSVIYGSRVIGTSRRVLSSKINNWLLGYHGGLEDRAYFEGWTSEGPAATVLNQYNSFAATGTGSISTFYKNGIQIASNGNGLQGPNGIQLNGYGGSYIETSDCEFTDVIIFGSALASATIAQISDNIGVNYEPQQTVCVNSPLTNIIHNTTGATGIGTASGLPAGVTALWVNDTITISGTPSELGIFNYSIPLTGGCGSAHATGTITVNGATTASSTPTLCINTALTNITHTTTGASGIGTATGLPAGVTASWANNTITITGSPSAAGTFNYSIPLTGGLCNATGTITVNTNTAGIASSTPTLCINSPLTNITHNTTDATGIGTAIGLPAGVTALWSNDVITISGTPSASGIFNYSIPLTGGCGSSNATGNITVTADMAVSLLPVDLVPNSSLALSLRKLRSAYTGPALRLRRESDYAEQDFGFAENDLDVNAISVWLNGANGYCTKLYDQSGNNGDVSQTTPAAQPLLVLSGLNNKPLLRFTTAQTMFNNVNYPAPFSVIYGSRVIGTSERVLSARNNNWLLGYWGGSQDRAYFEGWTSEGSAATVLNQYNRYAATGTGSISTFYKNGVQIASNSSGLQGPNGIQLNGSSYGERSNCEFTDVIIYGSALPAATIAQLSDTNIVNYEPNQTLCINTPLTNIIQYTKRASGIGTPTNLPSGVTASWTNNTITINGTPTTAGIFNYSIPLTGGCGSVNATGTITVIGNMTAAAASSTPTVCVDAVLTNITHTTTAATGILPTDLTAPNYALPPAVVNTTTDEDLGNVTIILNGATVLNNSTPINSLSGTIGTATGTAGSYADFTAFEPYAMYPGSTYSFSLSSITTGTGTYYNNSMAIYIDYNRNGVFSDAGEKVYAAASTTYGPHTETGTFTIPSSASLGLTRMRVISNEGIISSPTQSISYGEYEEYSINMGGFSSGLPVGVTASWANNTITISGTPTVSGTFNYSIELTGGCDNATATGTITVNPVDMALSFLPLDNVPNASVALSLRKLRSAYSGPALRLRRGSDNVEQDFSFVGNELDVSAITIWLNGASGYCTKLYDQSGNVGDVSQTTPAAQPLLVLSGFSNKPLLRFTTAQTMFNNVNYPAPFSVIYGSRVIGTSARVLSSKNNNWLLGYWGGKQDRGFFEGWISEGSATTVLNQYNCYAATGTGSVSTVFKNGIQIASNSNGLQGPNGIQLNGSLYGELSNCEFTDVIIYGSALSDTAIAQFSDNLGGNLEPNRTLCINSPLPNITFTTIGASGIGAATNLPAGVSASLANNTITISGTPNVAGIFNYSIPLTGGCGIVNATGTITVIGDIIAGAASSTPTLCVNTALTNITHTSTAATGIITYPAPSYALPSVISSPSSNDDLGNVTITLNGATILNNSTPVNSLSGTIGTATGTAGSYANFTAFGPYAMYPGSTYSFSLSSVSTSASSNNSMAIYIDYNRDGDFSYGEQVYAAAATTSGPHIETGTFTIPLSASVGLTRMRVISRDKIITYPYHYSGYPDYSYYGEYEDYSINLGNSSGLPTGVTASWANNTVTISGTPTESGTFNYSIDLTGNCDTATAIGTITVNPANLQPSAGSNGNLTICSTTNLTVSLLFAALLGTPSAGGVWSPAPNVANGSMTYTYTQPEIAPCGTTSATVAVIVTSPTGIGNDLSTSVVTGKNIAITPNVAPASATALMGYTNTDFKGLIAVHPTTGVINITNAHPAGVYSVIVKASDQGCAFATLVLTVNKPHCNQKQFINMPTITVDNGPQFVGVGDFNGDSIQDIATANGSSSSGSVSIRLGDGLGGFSGSTNVAVGFSPKSIAIGDFNSDGKQDIATANSNSSSVSIRLGDGLGGFNGTTNVAVGSVPLSVAIGDFNRDGKQDIATANKSSNTVSIRLGDGMGGFSGTTNVPVGSGPTSVVVGDFNSDGKQDIATATYYSISIRLGDGLGGFSGTTDFLVNLGSNHTSITLVDFNGDGKQDISTTTQFGSNVSISLGDGLGGFSSTIYVAAPLRSQAIGDFNGDGKQDIIGVSGSFMYILSDDELGGCSVLRETLSTVTTVTYIAPAVGDFNGDGIQDVAMVRSSSSLGQVLLRVGKQDAAEINLKGNGVTIPNGNTTTVTSNNTDFGTVTTRTFTIQNTGTGPLSISSIGISGVDAASFTTSWNTYPVLIAAGSETTFNLTCYSAILGTKTATVTINNDDCDEGAYTFKVQATNQPLTLGSYAAATILTAGGNATITPSAAPTGNGLGLTATTTASFKGKLTIDATSGAVRITNAQPAGTYQITVNTGLGLSQTFTLMVGNTICSQGQFLPATSLNVGANPSFTEVADFNNDGYQDFAVVLVSPAANVSIINPKDGIAIRLGNGSGSFTPGSTLSFGESISYLTINDFNGDGNADIIARGRTNLFIHLGNGLGGFTSGATINLISIGSQLTSILSDDLDQDSKMDFVVTGTSGFAVLKGNGQGGFSLLNTYDNGINLNFIEKGDFNGDGFTDLSMGNPTSSPSDGSNFIYFGDGNGGFSTGTSYSLGGFSRLSTVGDFDGDGKSDILSALANAPGTVAFQKNNGDGTFATPTYIGVGDSPTQAVSGDFNGDGKLDFATGNTALSTVSVRYGNGDGTFYGSTELLTNAPASSALRMIVGDFNNDGVQDLGTANNSSTTDNFSIFLGVSKKINIQGNAIAIISGDSLPDTADDTDFGVGQPTIPVTKTYTIQNGGTGDLVVSNITLSGLGAAAFTVGNILLPATVSAGNNVTFDLTFTSADLGVFNATVNIVNDDCNYGVYDFAVKSSVCTVVTPTLAIQSDALLAICPGTSVNFSVDTSENMGASPSYVWMKNGSAIPGEIASTYSTSNLLSTDQIALEMSSSLNSGCLSQVSNLSLPLSLMLKDSTEILTQPTAAAGCLGISQVFNVLATGTGALSYQWKKAGAPLMGETDSVLTLANTQAANAGLYTVDVSAECGTIASDTISLNVYPLPTTVATISTADLTDVSMCGKNSAQLVANDPSESQGVWSVADAWNIQFGSVNASTTSIVADNAALGGGLKKLYWSHIRTTDGVSCSSKDSIFVDFKQPTITPIASVIQNGDVVWGGLTDTDWSTGSNWYVYSSSGGANVLTRLTQGEPSATTNVYMLSDVIAGNCMSSTNVPSVGTGEFSNNLYVGQNATLNLSSGTLTLKGDLTNNGTLNPNSGTVIFSGTNAQRITGSGSIANFNNLTVNKSLGTLSLEQAVTVSGTLTMTAGNIQTDSTHILEVGISKSNPGSIAWVNGTVVGPLKRWFSADPNTTQASGIFPVGTSEFNRYAQINFTDASTGGYLIIKYVDGLPANAYDNFPLMITENNTNKYIQNADQDGYWEMTPYNESGVPYGSLDDKAYDLFLRINNPYSVQNGGILANPPGVRLIRAKGHSDGSHDDWAMAGTHTSTQALTVGEDYIVGAGGVVGFSWFNGGGDNANPLPIELLSFAGNCDQDQVVLNWQTASEHQSSYFEIEKSRNGMEWEVVNTQAAAGYSTETLSYSFVDANANNTENYYRMTQFDENGQSETFNPIVVSCDANSTIFRTMPNPSASSFQVIVSNALLLGKASIKMIDTKGLVVSITEVEIVDGVNVFYLNENVAPGIYYISIDNGIHSTTVLKHSVK